MANHLVIGLGGTGGSVLCALRKRIYEEFRSNDPTGDAHIEYLYVDSSLADLNNEDRWQVLGTSVQLAPAQRLSINGIGAGVLDNLDQYPGINAFINRRDEAMLKEGIGAIISEGIGGQRRRFGRMLIANNMCGLRYRVDEATNTVTRVAGNPYCEVVTGGDPLDLNTPVARAYELLTGDAGLKNRATSCGKGASGIASATDPRRVTQGNRRRRQPLRRRSCRRPARHPQPQGACRQGLP